MGVARTTAVRADTGAPTSFSQGMVTEIEEITTLDPTVLRSTRNPHPPGTPQTFVGQIPVFGADSCSAVDPSTSPGAHIYYECVDRDGDVAGLQRLYQALVHALVADLDQPGGWRCSESVVPAGLLGSGSMHTYCLGPDDYDREIEVMVDAQEVVVRFELSSPPDDSDPDLPWD
jgi:hypothetical protein